VGKSSLAAKSSDLALGIAEAAAELYVLGHGHGSCGLALRCAPAPCRERGDRQPTLAFVAGRGRAVARRE
jgi:hypothetical protein